jgi:hypothetical protein
LLLMLLLLLLLLLLQLGMGRHGVPVLAHLNAAHSHTAHSHARRRCAHDRCGVGVGGGGGGPRRREQQHRRLVRRRLRRSGARPDARSSLYSCRLCRGGLSSLYSIRNALLELTRKRAGSGKCGCDGARARGVDAAPHNTRDGGRRAGAAARALAGRASCRCRADGGSGERRGRRGQRVARVDVKRHH